jgi:hypothetical protein
MPEGSLSLPSTQIVRRGRRQSPAGCRKRYFNKEASGAAIEWFRSHLLEGK